MQLTGMLTGAAWAVKGGILGIISNYCKLKVNPTLSVQPHFQLAVSQDFLFSMYASSLESGNTMFRFKLFKF